MATVGLIYIGTFSAADTVESDFDNENDGVYAGTHGNGVLQAVVVEVSEPQGDGAAYDDDAGATPSHITYDLGGGPQTVSQDSVAVYNVAILLGDGSTLNTVVNVIQLTNGVTFINENSGGVPLDGLNIQSVTIGSLVEDNAVGWSTARSIDDARIVCFAHGTLIATPSGLKAVERLRVDDLVSTLDHGPQPVIWCAALQGRSHGSAAPVEIAAGALGPQIPAAPLMVSAQHRILLRSAIVARMTGSADVLVPAKFLCGVPGIARRPLNGPVRYHHIMLRRHGLVWANGALAETFYPGPEAIDALRPGPRARLIPHVPARYPLCRPVLGKARSLRLLDRHRKNAVALQGRGVNPPAAGV